MAVTTSPYTVMAEHVLISESICCWEFYLIFDYDSNNRGVENVIVRIRRFIVDLV